MWFLAEAREGERHPSLVEEYGWIFCSYLEKKEQFKWGRYFAKERVLFSSVFAWPLQALNVFCSPREDPFGSLCFAQLVSKPLAHSGCPSRRHNRSVCEAGFGKRGEMMKAKRWSLAWSKKECGSKDFFWFPYRVKYSIWWEMKNLCIGPFILFNVCRPLICVDCRMPIVGAF